MPVIVTLGGTEGGLSFTEQEANVMVREGFIVMRLGYFKYSKSTMKQTLKELRIEKVFEAIDWVKRFPEVDSARIALLGISKGAELALLVASKSTSIKAVAAHVPSHVVWYGIGDWKGLNKSSWTWQGEPMAFLPYGKPKSGWFTKRIAEFYESGLESYPEKIPPALIPVENISGPVLVSSGGKDDIWPSAFMAHELEKRLRLNGFPFEVQHLHFPEAGHGIFGLLPDQKDDKAMKSLAEGGGSSMANYEARKQTWQQTFSFFRRVFSK
jgi:dienelactone hydrolase